MTMKDMIIKEQCAEESDDFVDSIINIIQNFNNPKFDFVGERNIASRQVRNITKCILRNR